MENNTKQTGVSCASSPDALLLKSWEGPAILLVDLDAFFASVEQLDHPAWRGQPVVVGGDADKHGVVSTASYEARQYGIHSAMPSSYARRLCPHAHWTQGHFDRYREISQCVMDILRDETPHVQQVSIDEAFVDVTPTKINREHPVCVAQRIQRRVGELGISCSIGVATSKTVAKIASDMDKPCGLTVVYPGGEQDFLAPLPVRMMSGIGSFAEQKLRAHGIETLGQLACAHESMLVRLFGKTAHVLRMRACGQDESCVQQNNSVKSLSNETTFVNPLTQRTDIEAGIATMAAKVARRLRKKGLAGCILTLYVKFEGGTSRSVRRHFPYPLDDELVCIPCLYTMLDDVWKPGMSVRLVGVSISGLEERPPLQESLFDTEDLPSFSDACVARIKDKEKRRALLKASDRARERFGDEALYYGYELRHGYESCKEHESRSGYESCHGHESCKEHESCHGDSTNC